MRAVRFLGTVVAAMSIGSLIVADAQLNSQASKEAPVPLPKAEAGIWTLTMTGPCSAGSNSKGPIMGYSYVSQTLGLRQYYACSPTHLKLCNVRTGVTRPVDEVCPDTYEGQVSEWISNNMDAACSVPTWVPDRWSPDAKFNQVFLNDCRYHDACYTLATKSKAECDGQFLSDMLKTCKMNRGDATFVDCSAAARTYYGAVDVFGDGNYGKE